MVPTEEMKCRTKVVFGLSDVANPIIFDRIRALWKCVFRKKKKDARFCVDEEEYEGSP